MVELISMRPTEFSSFRHKVIEDYAVQSVKAGRFRSETSRKEAERIVYEILPDGVTTEDHFIYEVYSGNEQIGTVWTSLRRSEGMLWIYDIEVFKSFRRRGFGLEILYAVEESAREMDVHRVGLHVFGHNSGAVRLYERAGYETTSLVMTRHLKT